MFISGKEAERLDRHSTAFQENACPVRAERAIEIYRGVAVRAWAAGSRPT